MSTVKHLSLTSIYQALQTPSTSTTNTSCRQQLHAATVKQLDYTLRKLKSYSKQPSQWPARRLVRCLDYIFLHGIKPSPQFRDLTELMSMKACVRWVLKISAEEDAAAGQQLVISSVKFFGVLLESIASDNSLLKDIKQRGGAKMLLNWSQSSNSLFIRTYSVRALTAQFALFAKDLIHFEAYNIFSRSLLDIPSLINTLLIKPAVSDASQKRAELEQSIMTCRLLESLLRHDTKSAELVSFADSKDFHALVNVWHQICQLEYKTLKKQVKPLQVKNGPLLIYSLSTVIQKCTGVSQRAASYIAEEGPRSQWHPYLTLLMQRWVRDTCCSMNKAIMSTEQLSSEKRMLKKMIQISLDMVPILQHHMFWSDYVDQTVCDLTNFFMAYISQPILPEQAATIGGTVNTLMHTDICIDVEERGLQVTAEMLQKIDQDLLVLSFESFIQHVQLATLQLIDLVSGRVAWCLRSILTILVLNDNLEETSGLSKRMTKLIVFFLHYKDAIDTFAASTTSITPHVWGATIEQAKQGLITAVNLSPEDPLQPPEINTIYKAKRAFISLEKISNHPRACERLLDCHVLQLVNIDHIPTGNVMEKTSSLLTVYALFGRLIASLSKTAFVRSRLRDECGLIPMIIKLLQEAVEYKDKATEDPIILGWNQIISSCLMVISSFQYDEPSMRMWLAWKVEDNESITVLPCLLSILFRWRRKQEKQGIAYHLKKSNHHHHGLLLLAAQVLDQFSGIPLCGRQMIMDATALGNLAALMTALTSAAVVCQDTDQQLDDHAMMCNNEGKREVEQEETNQSTVEDYMEIEMHTPVVKPTLSEESVNFVCAGYLRRSAVRILICHDNIQFTILSDAYTSLFKPMLQHPSAGSSHEYWRRAICQEIYEKKYHDLSNLYQFTERDEQSIKLHEFTAVAVGYAILGSTKQVWNAGLGINYGKRGIVSTNSVFGVTCQMLVYELEYNEEPVSDILTLITPFRRHAAAQMVESLALELETAWRAETESIQENILIEDHIQLTAPNELVYFVTDDAPTLQISGNRQLLKARSPIFEAMLGAHYAEDKLNRIPLHDVTYHSLNLFITVIQEMNQQNDVLLLCTWQDVINLLRISDRFGSQMVKNRCEHWVLDKIKHLHLDSERKVCLEGLLALYRHCRDPIEIDGGITSTTWPFATLLYESLKALVQYLTDTCQTVQFEQMVKQQDVEELDAFCDGMAFLLIKR